MNQYLDSYAEIIFAGNVGVGLAVKLLKICFSQRSSPLELKKILIRYFLCYYAFSLGFSIQDPYVMQRYLDSNLTSAQISTILITFNLVSAFASLLTGYLLNTIKHRFTIMIAAVLLSCSSFLRTFSDFQSFVVAAALIGVAVPIYKVAFEDWWIGEQSELQCDSANMIFSENNALINLVMTIIMTFTSSTITKKFGTFIAFKIASPLFLVSIVPIACFFKNRNPLRIEITLSESIAVLKRTLVNQPIIYFVFLLDLCYSCFLFICMPRLTQFMITENIRPPHALVMGSYIVSNLNGAQLISEISNRMAFTKWIIFGTFVVEIAILLMYFGFDNKITVFTGAVIIGFSDGMLQSMMLVLKQKFYPKEIRGYLMSFLRVPISLIACFIIWFAKNTDLSFFLLILALIMALANISAIILHLNAPINDKYP